jgi:hypothetical protein
MRSKITIDVDFENGNIPVIQVLSKDSDDIRDRLIQSFYQTLRGSSWCKIEFRQDIIDDDPERAFKRIFITPLPESDLKKEAEIMLEQHRLNEEFQNKHN